MPKLPALLGTLAASALLSAASAVHAGDDRALSGTFTVGDHRIASGVAATTASYDPEARAREIGQSISFDDTLVWYDGRFCDDWQAVAGPAPDPIASDPNLADLQSDSATFTPIAITCDGAPFADFVQLDADTLIGFIPNGTMYVILHRTADVD